MGEEKKSIIPDGFCTEVVIACFWCNADLENFQEPLPQIELHESWHPFIPQLVESMLKCRPTIPRCAGCFPSEQDIAVADIYRTQYSNFHEYCRIELRRFPPKTTHYTEKDVVRCFNVVRKSIELGIEAQIRIKMELLGSKPMKLKRKLSRG